MKKKNFSVVLIIAIVLLSIPSIVSAASFNVVATLKPSEVYTGDEVKVTLSVSNIDKGDKDGINAISATIGFNSKVLTLISKVAEEGWTMEAYNQSDGTFVIRREDADYITSNQDLITFTFKVKEDAAVSSTDITVTDISAAFGVETDLAETKTFYASNTSKPLTITKKVTEQPVQEQTPQTPIVSQEVVNSGKSDDKSLPQTGVSDVIIPVMLILAVVSVVSYIRYKNYKNI